MQQGSTVVDGVSPAIQGRDTLFLCNATCFEKMAVGELQVRVCWLSSEDEFSVLVTGVWEMEDAARRARG